MLSSLMINNILLVQEAEVDFRNDFNVFTGETGAGKSILIDCIKAFSSEKSPRKLEVRDKSKDGSILLIFDLSGQDDTISFVQEMGIDIDPNESLVMKKLVKASGVSRYTVMDQPVAGATVAKIFEMPVEIDGQFSVGKIASRDYVYNCIERYSEDRQCFKDMSIAYERLQEQKSKISTLVNEFNKESEPIESLRSDIAELEELDIQEGEEDELVADKERYKQADYLSSKINDILEHINGDAMDQLRSAEIKMMKLSSVLEGESYSKINSIERKFNFAILEIEDAAALMEQEQEDLASAKEKMEYISSRLYDIRQVCKKHMCTADKITSVLQSKHEKVSLIENFKATLESMNRELEVLKQEYFVCAAKVSGVRLETIKRFSKDVSDQLLDLGFKEAKFTVKHVIKDKNIKSQN